jgi:hypothetical protein
MKKSTVGFVLAAILMVVAGVGFGIAQAGGNHTMGEFMEWQILEQSDSSSSSVPVLPSAIDVDYAADGNPSSEVAQARGAVETGSLPAESNTDSFVEIEGVSYYRVGGILYGP